MEEQDTKEKNGSTAAVAHYETEEVSNKHVGTDMNYRHRYVWEAVVIHVILQICWIWGMYVAHFRSKFLTTLWSYFLAIASGQAVSVGAHRGFSHKSYKMTPLMKFIFVMFFTMAGQHSLYTWVKDHKLHHKYSDTDADPHNAGRGFFFSHIGWLLVKPHPLLTKKRRQVDMTEILNDKLIMFHHNYFLLIYLFVGFLIPVAVPVLFWQETLLYSVLSAYFARYVSVLHTTWAINSVAHLWGTRPYDKRLMAVESSWVSFLSLGDGGHNYHHVFPWDYRHSLPGRYNGLSTPLIDFLAYLGLVYDLRTAPKPTVYSYLQRHGDGTFKKRDTIGGEYEDETKSTTTNLSAENDSTFYKKFKNRFANAMGYYEE